MIVVRTCADAVLGLGVEGFTSSSVTEQLE
jgi:hypothetical protein